MALRYAALPDRGKSGIAAIADSTFDSTNYSFNTIIASPLQRPLRVIQLAGGTVTDADVIIPRQESTAWKQWNPGRPARLIGIDDTAWTWSNAWT